MGKEKVSDVKKQFLSYRELAEVLGISEGTLRIWVMEGRLQPLRFGRKVKFSEAYVEEIKKRGVPSKYGDFKKTRSGS